jgi:hypothetical protein
VSFTKDTEADFENELFTYTSLNDYYINEVFKNIIVILLYDNSRGSAVGTLTMLWAAQSAVQFQAEARNFFFTKHVKTGSGATQPPTPWL